MPESKQEPAEPDFQLPPASFMFLVESLLMQAQMQLGLFPFAEKEEDNQPNLPLAKHSIDLLSVLQDKTRGNLSTDENRLLENGLTEMRFRFVQVSEDLKKKQSAVNAPADKKDDRPLIITPDGGKGSKTE